MGVILAVTLTEASPVDVIRDWGNGLSGLLAFMTQMALVFVMYALRVQTPQTKSLPS